MQQMRQNVDAMNILHNDSSNFWEALITTYQPCYSSKVSLTLSGNPCHIDFILRNRNIFQWLSARLQYLQYVSIGDAAVLHWIIYLFVD